MAIEIELSRSSAASTTFARLTRCPGAIQSAALALIEADRLTRVSLKYRAELFRVSI